MFPYLKLFNINPINHATRSRKYNNISLVENKCGKVKPGIVDIDVTVWRRADVADELPLRHCGVCGLIFAVATPDYRGIFKSNNGKTRLEMTVGK